MTLGQGASPEQTPNLADGIYRQLCSAVISFLTNNISMNYHTIFTEHLTPASYSL